MDKKYILSLSATSLAKAIREKEITVEEAVGAVFANIDENNGRLNVYISDFKEAAMDDARKCDQILLEHAGDPHFPDTLPPLFGVPVAVKNNLLVKGRQTACASRMLRNYVAPYSATCVNKLKEAGAILIGSTNMDEFGMGSSTETSDFGPTRNPLDPTRVPGGSSGGSAAAVASGMAFAALGTDTGGSVRQPAAYCGLFGLRPTYGAVSRHGLIAFSSSMDQVGPIARSSLDIAGLFNIVKGVDEKDQTTVLTPDIDFPSMRAYEIYGKRIGIPKQLVDHEAGISQDVLETMQNARTFFEEHGAVVEEIDMPILDYAVAIYYILSSAEASSNLSRYDGIRYGNRAKDDTDISTLINKSRTEGFGLEVKRRILLGNYVLSSEHFEDCYRQAERARTLVKSAFDAVFRDHDLILCPTAPGVAPLLGSSGKDLLTTYMADLFTIPASLAGIPAISVPFGCHKLPAAIQLIGRRFGEQEILGAAYFIEKHEGTFFSKSNEGRADT